MRYNLTKKTEEKAFKFLTSNLPTTIVRDFDSFIRNRYELQDTEELIELCEHEYNYPLLLDDKNLYFQNCEGILLIPIFKNRLKEVLKLEEQQDFFFDRKLSTHFWNYNERATLDDLLVFSGAYLLSLIGNKMFVINYQEYEFNSFTDFIYSINAYIFNIKSSHIDYRPQFSWETKHKNGKTYRNQFDRDTHGDFRFKQHDITPKSSISPYNEKINFNLLPEANRINAYHSEECRFYALILNYIDQLNIHSNILSNYEEFKKTFQKVKIS